MKYWVVIFFLLLADISSAQTNTFEFQALYDNGLISISVEKGLYETKSSEHFFIHYQIKNLGEYNLEVYTKEYHRLFYPNQWGITDTTERMIIDERRIVPNNLNDTTQRWVEKLYQKGKLTTIKPGETLNYYRDFNNGSKANIRFSKGEYMFISMDGELFYLIDQHIYDSEFEYNIGCAHFGSDKFSKNCNLYLPYPITFKQIPTNSIIFNEN